MLIRLLMLAIFTRPLLCSPAFPDINELYSALLLLLLTSWMVLKGLALQDHRKTTIPLLFFIGALFFSLIFAENKLLATQALTYYISGILLFLICRTLPAGDKRKIIITLIASGIFVSLLAAYQYFFGFQNLTDYITENRLSDPYVVNYIDQKRVYYPFITPNALGGYLIMIIPLALAMNKKLWTASILFLALLSTKSIGALFSLLPAMAVYFHLKDKCTKKALFILSGGLVALAVVFFVRMQTAHHIFEPSFSSQMKLNYWRDTLSVLLTHFWTGIGLGNFDSPFSRYSHNAFLQIWAETGIIGALSFIILIATIIRSGLKEIAHSQDKAMTIGLLAAACAFLIHNFVDFTFFLPEISLIWWAILGLLSNRSSRCP